MNESLPQPHHQDMVLGGSNPIGPNTGAVLGILHRTQLKDRAIRELDGYWHLLKRPEQVWGSTSYWYRTLEELVEKEEVILGEKGRDEYGEFWTEKAE